MTPRQIEAFGVYAAALRVWLIVKAKPCSTNEESKERWRQLQALEKDMDNAREEIDASIIDTGPEEVEECDPVNGQPVSATVGYGREPIVWADDATPFTGPQVRNLLLENEALRKKLGQAEHELGTMAASNTELRGRIDRGRAAHNEERVARDSLAHENEELRQIGEAAHECQLAATKDHAGFALIPVKKYETLCNALSAYWKTSSQRAVRR